jgi:hypothetical protein
LYTALSSGETLPSVKLGEQAVNAIRWIDEQYLLIVIPSTLQAGVYPVFVTNTSGESAPMISALLIGKPTHLPIVLYGRWMMDDGRRSIVYRPSSIIYWSITANA